MLGLMCGRMMRSYDSAMDGLSRARFAGSHRLSTLRLSLLVQYFVESACPTGGPGILGPT